MNKYVYNFKEGNRTMNKLLGSKGANLSEMLNLRLPIPEGIIITTELCNMYIKEKKISEMAINEIYENITKIEKEVDKNLGCEKNPLLLSIRSGSSVSMPGMLDTILNLGLNDVTVEALGKITSNKIFAYDCYRRFIMMFADVVNGINKNKFEKEFSKYKKSKGYKKDSELLEEDYKEIVGTFKRLYKEEVGEEIPTEPKKQIIQAITAVFESWNNTRAKAYRKINNISQDLGTAVIVQRMVFGNMDKNSGTLVLFTRNPITGENNFFGEYLEKAQGEDIVAGVRTPKKLEVLEEKHKSQYVEIIKYGKKLENYYKEVQDIEITIEEGKVFILQTRNGKRTATAAMKIAVDFVEEGLITKEEALLSIDTKQVERLLHPNIINKKEVEKYIIGRGLPASPGAVAGKIYFTIKSAEKAFKKGEDIILVREETSPEDITGMEISKGILTVNGGLTSHASVVARSMGKCCICGCSDIQIYEEDKYFILNGVKYKESDYLSLDGSTGEIYNCKIETKQSKITGNFYKIMEWSDEIRTLKIKANADTPKDVRKAMEFGAKGIGVVRSEHMFFEENKITKIHKMIMADTDEERKKAVLELMPYQKEDFKGIFKEVGKLGGVTIRLLDPPLHEFLPSSKNEFKKLSKILEMNVDKLKRRANELKEINPMMGHRGCRLASTYPEIPRMQTRAILESAIEVMEEDTIEIVPEILIPLIVGIKEFTKIKKIIIDEAEKVIKEYNVKIKYKIGAMIETPRSALIAEALAKEADFFSVGTNDLTQLTFSLSRDDTSEMLTGYLEQGTFHFNPTTEIDVNGVGKLIEMAKKGGRKIKKDLEIGICGEHSSDPKSIIYFDKIGMDYVSCTTYKIPVARLATAQATIINRIKI